MAVWRFDAIGTTWRVTTGEPLGPDVVAEVLDRIEQFDRAWSRFRDDSLVTAMSRRAGTWELPSEADDLLGFYAELHDATDGAVDPLVGQALVDLGYDARYSLVPSAEPRPAPPRSSFSWRPPALTTAEPVLLDMGAAGKGLLVDLVATVVRRETHQWTVDAGGDILHGGTTPLRVALEDPADASRAIGVAVLDPEDALCASATNRRAWGDGLHHVLDARTGRPTTDVVATWVVASSSCMHADGIATAHFFAEPEPLVARFPHEFVRMHADGRVAWSAGFPGEVFA